MGDGSRVRAGKDEKVIHHIGIKEKGRKGFHG
jgi:hypothetical protein